MKKSFLIVCSLAAGLFFTSCGDVEESSFEGTVNTGYNTFPLTEFSYFSGTQRAEAATRLYSFMTQENKKYWEAFEYSDEFSNYEEYAKLLERQRKKCTDHYVEQRSRLEEEDLNQIFASAPDSCVFTARFQMTLQAFPVEYDTAFVVQRPAIPGTKWEKVANSGHSDIQAIEFIDESSVKLYDLTGEELIKYRRSGNIILLSDSNDETIYRIRIPSIRNFILFDSTGDVKYGEYAPLVLTAGE